MRANKTLRYFSARVKELPQLTSREKDILLSRLEDLTLKVIGKKHGLTAERIRQIELNAIEKIKSKSKQLRLFKS